MASVICPRCGGRGRTGTGHHVPSSPGYTTEIEETCYQCLGTGRYNDPFAPELPRGGGGCSTMLLLWVAAVAAVLWLTQ
jgi:hypothetical protein